MFQCRGYQQPTFIIIIIKAYMKPKTETDADYAKFVMRVVIMHFTYQGEHLLLCQ